MKKTLYISAIATLLAGSALTSCSDFLDADNKSAGGVTADAFFSSNPQALLTSTYASVKGFANLDEAIYEHGSDLYMPVRAKTASPFQQFTTTVEDKNVQNLYVKCYATINYANGVIKYAGEESSEAYEARFLRNYAYYVLTQQFGAVPYITEYINSASRDYPITPLNDIYANVTKDLEDLYNNSTLPATDNASGRPSKQAAAALLAKFYLAAGWDIDTKVSDAEKGTYQTSSTTNFENAAKWANTAIGGKKLTISFEEKWNPSLGKINDEVIWAVKYQTAGLTGDVATEGNGQMGTYGGYYGVGVKGCDSDNQTTAKALCLFEEGDLRFEGTFMTTFYAGQDVASGYMTYYNGNTANHAINLKFFPYYTTEAEADAWLAAHKAQMVKGENPNTVKAAILDPDGFITYTFKADGSVDKKTKNVTQATFFNATDCGVVVKKFDDPQTINYCYRDIVCLHLSEMYLVAAEANLMAGNSSAFWSNINEVRGRAGLAPINSIGAYNPAYTTTPAFGNITELDLLLDERARELYAEKTRYEDLRRTKQLVRYNIEFNNSIGTVNDMKGSDGEIKWLRPIPQTEIDNNTAITADMQNPGYRTPSSQISEE